MSRDNAIFRNRDAFGAIRGYAYQIYQTVQRWLTLHAYQVLELERGEDIDLISQLLNSSADIEQEHRVLEQIKFSEKSVTLRSAQALEALANFHDHRLQNPSLDLHFSFVTNAAAGLEQLSPFPNEIPGICLWNQLRRVETLNSASCTSLESIRQFLLASGCPEKVSASIWKNWREFLANVEKEDFKAFIDRFQWITSEPDAERIPIKLAEQIIEMAIATSREEAESLVGRLVVYVLRLLSKPGPKRLTVEDRNQVFSQPTLEAADRKLLHELQTLVNFQSSQIEEVKESVLELSKQYQALVKIGGTIGRIEAVVPRPDVSLPPTVLRLSPRQNTVQNLIARIQKSRWLALHGRANEGKSQLALQVANAWANVLGWIRFHHDQPIDQASATLAAALAAVLPNADFAGQSLLVLDDLPRISGDVLLAEDLDRLLRTAEAKGIRLLSTSQYELPIRLTSQLAAHELDHCQAPPFNDEEAIELFRASGAPEAFINNSFRITFLNGLAGGHPLLLAATADFLKSREWQYQTSEVESLFRGDHAVTIVSEVIDRLVRTLSNESRELLYRLTLPSGLFSLTEVTELGQVQPSVPRLQEHFTKIQGAWVSRESSTQFTVSPLVKSLGETEISVTVRATCYRALADRITRNQTLALPDWQNAVFYNMKAGDSGRALTLYVHLLSLLLSKQIPEHVVSYIDLWRNTELPSDQPVGMRLLVRGFQLAVFLKLKMDTTFVLNDIDRLVAQSTERDGWGLVAVASYNVVQLSSIDPKRTIGYIRKVIELPRIIGSDGKVIHFGQFPLCDLLWMIVLELRTPAILEDWLTAVNSIQPQDRQKFWNGKLGQRAVKIVANKLYMTEWEKPKSNQNWDYLLFSLDRFLTQIQPMKQPRLETAFTVVMIQVLGELKREAEISHVANRTLNRWPSEADVQFKIRGAWGRECRSKTPSEAQKQLDLALAQQHSPDDHERLRSLLAANLCVEVGDLRYAVQARDLARTSPDAPQLECVRALGEYALALAHPSGSRESAFKVFSSWSECIRSFLEVSEKCKIWRDMSVLIGHVTNYFTSWASHSRMPIEASDREQYRAPDRGFLMQDYFPDREAMYDDADSASISLLMYHYASAVHDSTSTYYWLRQTIETAKKSNASFIQTIIGIDGVAVLLAENKFIDAIEMGIYSARGLAIVSKSRNQTKREAFGVGIDINLDFENLSFDKRIVGESFSIISGVIPLALRIGQLMITDSKIARIASQSASTVFNEISFKTGFNNKVWHTIACIFQKFSGVPSSSHTFEDSIASIEDVIAQFRDNILVLDCLVSSNNSTLIESLKLHISIIDALLSSYPPSSAVYKLLLLPYVTSFWGNALTNYRFSFRNPDFITDQYKQALLSPESTRAISILKEVSYGFKWSNEARGKMTKVFEKYLC